MSRRASPSSLLVLRATEEGRTGCKASHEITEMPCSSRLPNTVYACCPPWQLEMQHLGGFAFQFPFLALLSLSFLFRMEELKAESFIPSPFSALHRLPL